MESAEGQGKFQRGGRRTCGYVTRGGGCWGIGVDKIANSGRGIQVEFWERCREFGGSSERLGREIQMAFDGDEGRGLIPFRSGNLGGHVGEGWWDEIERDRRGGGNLIGKGGVEAMGVE